MLMNQMQLKYQIHFSCLVTEGTFAELSENFEVIFIIYDTHD